MTQAWTVDLLPYHDRLERRDPESIDLLVIHCTELPDLATAREYGERILYRDSGTGNAGHFYIDRDGSTYSWVKPERIAHHVVGHNTRSVGIELVNRGRFPDWLDSRCQSMDEPYPDAQVEALLNLVSGLEQSLPSLRWIAGHDELDTKMVPASDDAKVRVRRKLDPGPLFPWKRVWTATRLEPFMTEAAT